MCLGQSVRLASVRCLTLPSWRKDSRRRMHGGELRLGTVSMYMATNMAKKRLKSKKIDNLHGYILRPKNRLHQVLKRFNGRLPDRSSGYTECSSHTVSDCDPVIPCKLLSVWSFTFRNAGRRPMRDFNIRYENLFVPIVSRRRVCSGNYCFFFWMRQRPNAARQDREQDQ